MTGDLFCVFCEILDKIDMNNGNVNRAFFIVNGNSVCADHIERAYPPIKMVRNTKQ